MLWLIHHFELLDLVIQGQLSLGLSILLDSLIGSTRSERLYAYFAHVLEHIPQPSMPFNLSSFLPASTLRLLWPYGLGCRGVLGQPAACIEYLGGLVVTQQVPFR